MSSFKSICTCNENWLHRFMRRVIGMRLCENVLIKSMYLCFSKCIVSSSIWTCNANWLRCFMMRVIGMKLCANVLIKSRASSNCNLPVFVFSAKLYLCYFQIVFVCLFVSHIAKNTQSESAHRRRIITRMHRHLVLSCLSILEPVSCKTTWSPH